MAEKVGLDLGSLRYSDASESRKAWCAPRQPPRPSPPPVLIAIRLSNTSPLQPARLQGRGQPGAEGAEGPARAEVEAPRQGEAALHPEVEAGAARQALAGGGEGQARGVQGPLGLSAAPRGSPREEPPADVSRLERHSVWRRGGVGTVDASVRDARGRGGDGRVLCGVPGLCRARLWARRAMRGGCEERERSGAGAVAAGEDGAATPAAAVP